MISHHQRTRLTYDALDRDSNALARGLQKIGVKQGDRVAVSLGNNVEFATVSAHAARHTPWTMLIASQDDICSVQAWGDSGRPPSQSLYALCS